MTTIALTSTNESGFLESDFDQIKSTLNGLDTGDITLNNAKITFPEAPEDGTQYAREDGAWVEVTSGGTPGGSTTQMQYNNTGSFGGITNVTSDGTDLFINGKQINIQSTAPSSPSTGDIYIEI